MEQPVFMIVEDEPLVLRTFVRDLAPFGAIQAFSTRAAAIDAIATVETLCALVVDHGLPDGSGIDVIAEARARFPGVPAVVITGSMTADVVHRAYALRARYLCKPASRDELRQFAADALEDNWAGSIGSAVHGLSKECRFTPAETHLLRGSMSGLDSGRLMERRKISLGTYKTHVKSIRRKTGGLGLGDLRDRLLRQLATKKK